MAAPSIQLKGGFKANDPRLGRVPQFDERSRKYSIRKLIGPKPPRSYTWRQGVAVDQGDNPSCVGCAGTHELAARPLVVPGLDYAFAHALYRVCQENDEWPGHEYDGTSVLALGKVLKMRGHIGGYGWAFTMEELVIALGYAGPVVFGERWTRDMFRPNAQGFIRPTGVEDGGHAIEGFAIKIIKTNSKPISWDNVDYDLSHVTKQQSWGPKHGLGGVVKMSLADLWANLQHDGETMLPLGRKVVV